MTTSSMHDRHRGARNTSSNSQPRRSIDWGRSVEHYAWLESCSTCSAEPFAPCTNSRGTTTFHRRRMAKGQRAWRTQRRRRAALAEMR
jgi:hypothetical protein